MPPEFWQTEQFEDAFAAQHIGRVARAYRTHPYHQAVYGPDGISQTVLGQWLAKRRMFLSLTSPALTAPAHQWLVHEPEPLVSGLAGRRVSGELVGRLSAMVAELSRVDDVAGGGNVLAMAQQPFAWAARLLDRASYDEYPGRALRVVLAELHIRHAETLRTLRGTSGCTAAISQARTQVEQLKPDDNPSWLYGMGHAAITVDAGECLLRTALGTPAGPRLGSEAGSARAFRKAPVRLGRQHAPAGAEAWVVAGTGSASSRRR